MSKKKKAKKKTKQPTASARQPSPAAKASAQERPKPALTILAVIGVLATLWAIFLWSELNQARKTGETPFCAFGESDCGLLWDAAFASDVHRLTGVPVAGWGVVWGLVATVVALYARGAQGRNTARRLSGVKWTASAGAVGLAVLLGASAYEGLFCTSCALTYVLTAAYVGVAFFVLKPPAPMRLKGLEIAAAATAGAFVLLLYPGLQTPKSRAREDQRVLEEAARRQAAQAEAPITSPSAAEGSESDAAGGAETSAADGPASRARSQLDRQLKEFLDEANPQLKQALANALAFYRDAKHHEEDPRFLQGSYAAPVRITEFTDALCSHCATLHMTLSQVRNLVPEGSFSVDARHYPLDGNCNRELPVRGPETVRCAAARAQICMESSPRAAEFSSAIFEKQRELRTTDQVFEIARGFISRSALRSCMDDPETARKLADDVEYASHFDPTGTPLVLINGREISGLALAPFIYTMVMAGGDDDHPLFASLPAPDPDAFN